MTRGSARSGSLGQMAGVDLEFFWIYAFHRHLYVLARRVLLDALDATNRTRIAPRILACERERIRT